MLDFANTLGFCRDNYPLLCDVLGYDPRRRLETAGESLFRQNEVASLLTAFVSCGCFHELAAVPRPVAFAGYSVGQWTAMHLAGMLDFESLMRSLYGRADIMNQSRSSKVGAMLGIIGLPLAEVEQICATVSLEGERVAISNINCIGQTTVAGPKPALDRVATLAAERKARKVEFANVSGAWHCYLLDDVIDRFATFVDGTAFASGKVPVVDNTTGEYLPADIGDLRRALVRHLNHAVRWEAGIRGLIAQGANEFVEIGYGNMLTKFGFFIDRSLRNLDFAAYRNRFSSERP